MQDSEEEWVFSHKTLPQKNESVQNDPRKDWKISASFRGTKTVVWNRCSYQVPAMVGTNASTNENNKFYNSTVQAISRGGGDCSTKFVSLFANYFDMGDTVKLSWEMG